MYASDWITQELVAARRPLAARPLDIMARSAREVRALPAAPVRAPSSANEGMDEAALRALISAIYRRGSYKDAPTLVGVTATRVLEDQPSRSYLFIQNQSAADQIIVRFGQQPSFGPSVQGLGIVIPPNFGFYEPILVPTDEVWLIASVAGTPCYVGYSVG